MYRFLPQSGNKWEYLKAAGPIARALAPHVALVLWVAQGRWVIVIEQEDSRAR